MVELIRAALEVLQSGFSYESVFRFLKTGLVMPLAGLSPEVIYQAENYVIALGIRGLSGGTAHGSACTGGLSLSIWMS